MNPGGRTASYRMEDLDAPAELRRLAAQVRLVRGLEEDFLDRAGLAEDHRLLDLGCGPGFFARWAASSRVPRGWVIGVDADPALVALAAEGGVGEFLVGSATEVPLPDASVDFAYARFLFQHLDDPPRVLAEMRRVTRPGGTVAIVDTDDGGLIVHPEPEGFQALLGASAEAQAARGGDRAVGRKLKALLGEAGLDEPRVKVYPFTTEDVGAEAFVQVTLGFKAGVLGPPWIGEAELARAVDALRISAREAGFFGLALGWAAWARVPR